MSLRDEVEMKVVRLASGTAKRSERIIRIMCVWIINRIEEFASWVINRKMYFCIFRQFSQNSPILRLKHPLYLRYLRRGKKRMLSDLFLEDKEILLNLSYVMGIKETRKCVELWFVGFIYPKWRNLPKSARVSNENVRREISATNVSRCLIICVPFLQRGEKIFTYFRKNYMRVMSIDLFVMPIYGSQIEY